MQVKQIKPVNFIFFRTETKIAELSSFLPVGQELFKEAVQQQLAITGPIHWHYFGFTDVNKPFTLEIALPVASLPPDYDGKFHLKRTEIFKCISETHDGSWLTMPSTYEKIFVFAAAQKLTACDQNREIYTNVDFNDPDANTTEIQFGVC